LQNALTCTLYKSDLPLIIILLFFLQTPLSLLNLTIAIPYFTIFLIILLNDFNVFKTLLQDLLFLQLNVTNTFHLLLLTYIGYLLNREFPSKLLPSHSRLFKTLSRPIFQICSTLITVTHPSDLLTRNSFQSLSSKALLVADLSPLVHLISGILYLFLLKLPLLYLISLLTLKRSFFLHSAFLSLIGLITWLMAGFVLDHSQIPLSPST